MSDFFKKFLLEDPRRLSPSGRYVALAAFGKHPGWDDHIEPRSSQETNGLGLETESLNLAKTVLYVKGIGGQIDSGAWEKLDSTQQLPAFKHLFVWQRSGQILIGRLWSSSDGKGRTRYPMVTCLHFTGVTLGWALKQALPALRELEEGCSTTTSAADVCSLLSRKRAALRQAIQATEDSASSHAARHTQHFSQYAPLSPDAVQNILRPFGGPKSEAFLRAIYQVQSQFGAFVTGKFKASSTTVTSRAQQVRVPLAGKNPEEALLFWTRFLLAQLDASVPLLLTVPLEEGWIDATVGAPESHEFFCLRASPNAVPLVSEVPYNLDDAFRAKATAFLEEFSQGETTSSSPSFGVSPSGVSPPPKTGWRKWLGIAVLLMLGAAAALFFLPNTNDRNTQVATRNTPLASNNLARAQPSPAPKPEVVAQTPATNPSSPSTINEIERSRSNAAVLVAKQKLEAEAAVKQRERQLAEAARIAKEKEATKSNTTLQPPSDLTIPSPSAKAAVPATVEAPPQPSTPPPPTNLAAVDSTKPADSKPAKPPVTTPSTINQIGGLMTNTIGMVLVKLPSGVWVGKYEVTRAEYARVIRDAPSTINSPSINDRRPIEQVSWSDANDFCRRLTEMERSELPAGKAYSLPTAKQWNELLGGQRFWDLPARGITSREQSSEVGQGGPPNKYGLFDVLGNVWEWCLDGGKGEEKLMKGGAFNSTDYERKWLPGNPLSNCGFRCVLAGP